LDPPYEMEREYGAAMELLAEAKTELVVAQHSVRMAMAEAYGELEKTRVVRQGDNALTFYAWAGRDRAYPTPTELEGQDSSVEQKGD